MSHGGGAEGGPAALLRRVVDVREGEVRALLLSSAFFFCVLFSYFLIKPVRETMGLRGGVDELSWLYLGTLGATLAATPLYTLLVRRLAPGRFIPWVYRFFIVNLVGFYLLDRVVSDGELARKILGYSFFVWLSVFNLFAVAVYRSFMADLFTNEQGKRLFGFIGVGGTVGAMLGSWASGRLIQLPLVGLGELMLVSAALLEVGVWVFLALLRGSPSGERVRAVDTAQAPGLGLGGAFRAFSLVGRSPYMLGICLFMLCFTVTSTLVYFTKMDAVARATDSETRRLWIFSNINLITQTLTLVTQLFFTGRIIRSVGVGATLAIIPVVTLAGFVALAVAPALGVVIALESVRSAANYALTRPAREVLFTVLTVEEKYKAKALIDTFVYRGGDVVGALAQRMFVAASVPLAGVAGFVAALALGWTGLAIALGRRQRDLAAPAASAGPG
ncbi:MAG: MFS transporter [Phycisphaeraceae bacterium]|nr:MFS transporter [Phycisphaeraceae bacterium]